MLRPRNVASRPLAALALLLLAVMPAAASPPPPSFAPTGPALAADPALASLVAEALDRRPELAQARAAVQADYARVPQARALPEPVLSLGLQNDGFKSLQVGRMETSWWSISAGQTFPWLGKRGLRAGAATLGARQAEADLDRVRLSVRAEVERAYVDLLLVRDRMNLLGRLEALWTQAEGLSRSRYETGGGTQTDILRAQLERNRLQQQRWALVAEERQSVVALNRAVGRALDQPAPTGASLADLADPPLPDSAETEMDAEARSPELRRALLGVQQSGTLTALAKRDYFPDLTVSAGVMPRGGEFEPMWQAGVSFTIPVWAGSRQSKALAESRLRATAARNGAEAVRRVLQQRVEERHAVLGALLESNRLYRTGLLVQSQATATSALAQYQVGRLPFVSVLEALNGYLGDVDGFYQSLAATQRVDIAQREVSLDPVAGPAAQGMAGAALPGGGGMSQATARAASASPPAGASSPATSMPRM